MMQFASRYEIKRDWRLYDLILHRRQKAIKYMQLGLRLWLIPEKNLRQGH